MGGLKGNVAKMPVRRAFLRGEGRDQGADNVRRLAPNVLKGDRVFLLRHDARSRRHVVTELNPAKLIGGPDVKILGQPAQSYSHRGQSRQHLGYVVASRNGVNRVF